VRVQVKGSRIVEYLKTDGAYRIVDLCPEAAEYLRNFVGERNGLLFPSRKPTAPVCYGNFLKRYLTPAMTKLGIKEPGKAFHAFRRFRSSVLAKSRIEEDLRKFWLGHENNDITAQYAEQIRDELQTRITALLRDVGLEPYFMHRYPHEMSGGQRQLIAIARAIALHPDFIVADEPVSALDVSVQAQIVGLLLDLQQKNGFLMIFHFARSHYRRTPCPARCRDVRRQNRRTGHRSTGHE